MSKLRGRISALEYRRAPPVKAEISAEEKAVRETVGRIFEVIRAWEREVDNPPGPTWHLNRRSWRDGPSDLFERIAPEDREVFQHILDMDKTF